MTNKLEEWLKIIKRNKTLDSIGYKPFVSILEDNIKLLDNNFKESLIELFLEYGITKFYMGVNHFFLLSMTINYHIELKKLHSENAPFSDDKYFKKLATKIKKFEFIKAPVRDYLKKYKSRCEELLSNFNFYTTSTTARGKKRDMHLLIDDLINLITEDNYAKDRKYKNSFRNSKKSIEFIKAEDEIEIISARTGKRYYKSIE